MIESLDALALAIHARGLIVLAGRVSYVAAGRYDKENFKPRVRGMQLTFTSGGALTLAIALVFPRCRLPL